MVLLFFQISTSLEELFGIEENKSLPKGTKTEHLHSSPDKAVLKSYESGPGLNIVPSDLESMSDILLSSQKQNPNGATERLNSNTTFQNYMQNQVQLDTSVPQSNRNTNSNENLNSENENVSSFDVSPDLKQVKNMQQSLPVIENLLQTQTPRVKDVSNLETIVGMIENPANLDQKSDANNVTSMYSSQRKKSLLPHKKSSNVAGPIRSLPCKRIMTNDAYNSENEVESRTIAEGQTSRVSKSSSDIKRETPYTLTCDSNQMSEEDVSDVIKSRKESHQGETCSS